MNETELDIAKWSIDATTRVFEFLRINATKKIEHASPGTPSYLEKLPGELRNCIYDYILADIVNARVDKRLRLRRIGHDNYLGHQCKKFDSNRGAFQPSLTLLQINRQIRLEIRPLIIDEFIVSIPLRHASAFITAFYPALTRDAIAMGSVKGSIKIVTRDSFIPGWKSHASPPAGVLAVLDLTLSAPGIACRLTVNYGLDLNEFVSENWNAWHEAIKQDLAEVVVAGTSVMGIILVFKKTSPQPFINMIRKGMWTKVAASLGAYLNALGWEDALEKHMVEISVEHVVSPAVAGMHLQLA